MSRHFSSVRYGAWRVPANFIFSGYFYLSVRAIPLHFVSPLILSKYLDCLDK
jgi:hypothetical protein